MSRVASYGCALATSTALLFIVSAVEPGSQAQTQQFFDAGQERQASVYLATGEGSAMCVGGRVGFNLYYSFFSDGCIDA